MLERFDEHARGAVEAAYQAARDLDHDQVGTEHVLLGVLSEGRSSAARALTVCGTTLESCRAKVAEAVASKRPGTQAPELTLTDRANLALERAGRLALRQKCDHIQADHLLLSILDVEGTAGQVLRGLSVDLDCVRNRLNAGSGEDPGWERTTTRPDQGGPVAPRCPRCGSNLESALSHRVLRSRGDDGASLKFVVAYCSSCGAALAGVSPPGPPG